MKIQINERMKQILDTKELEVMEAIIEGAEDWISVVNTLEDGEALDALGIDDQEAVDGAYDYATLEAKKYGDLEADLKNSAEEMNPNHLINDLHLLMLEAKADAIEINYTDAITEALADLSAADENEFLNAANAIYEPGLETERAFKILNKFQFGDGSEGNPCFQ